MMMWIGVNWTYYYYIEFDYIKWNLKKAAFKKGGKEKEWGLPYNGLQN